MKAYESSSDSSIDYVLESEGEGDSWDTFSNSQEEDFEINVNGYVVVNMKTNIIPVSYLVILELLNIVFLFIGNVTEVSAMQKSGSGWRWPGRKDEMWYKKCDVIRKINEPKKTSRRGLYEVCEIKAYNTEMK